VNFKNLKFKKRHTNVLRDNYESFVISMPLSSLRTIEIIKKLQIVELFNVTFTTELNVQFDGKL
jgi:hypothetical protein